MDLESRYFSALGGALSWTVEGDQLALSGAESTLLSRIPLWSSDRIGRGRRCRRGGVAADDCAPDDSCSEQERLLVAETIARLGRADSYAIDASLSIERLGRGDSRLVEESVLTFWSDDTPVIGFTSR